MNRNLHKYFIDLETSHMIQQSSGYDPCFPRKLSWFESQLCNNILFYFYFIFCFCCFYFDLFYLFLFIFNRINNPPTSAFRYKSQKAVYFVFFTEIQPFLESTLITDQFLTPRIRFLCNKIFYRVYIKFLIICILVCPKLLDLLVIAHKKK